MATCRIPRRQRNILRVGKTATFEIRRPMTSRRRTSNCDAVSYHSQEKRLANKERNLACPGVFSLSLTSLPLGFGFDDERETKRTATYCPGMHQRWKDG